jgi:phospholipid-translocating P-type ATPase (flippase)
VQYDEVLDMPCMVRSSNLVQELGMVSNVFSDKTGTLTRNEMKFVKFVVDGKLYDMQPDSDGFQGEMSPPSGKGKGGALPLKKGSVEADVRALLDGPNGTKNKVYDFLRCLTTCHTVIREKDGTYRAESPDELALVEGVGKFQCSLGERGTSTMQVIMLGERQTYEILAVNAFNSDRKRMSILLKDKSSNEYFLMCKGADSTTLDLCQMDEAARKSVDKSLLDLACFGLRTLCVAQKKISEEEANTWLNQYRAACTSLNNRGARMAEAGSEIEVGMVLLGITAIEDRLQDEVPEVIADLARAGIILWMLTGDKEETAINIGHSCNLLLNDTKVFFLTKLINPAQYTERLKEISTDIDTRFLKDIGYQHDDGKITEVALVMDGPSFEHFQFEDKEQRAWLLKIGKACRSVIGCRLTPIQKQQVVNLVKTDTFPKCTTLSIGDGANDVSMIREADVGVGIFGKEVSSLLFPLLTVRTLCQSFRSPLS